MKHYYLDADDLIAAVRKHKEHMHGSWAYDMAHEHIIKMIEMLKKYAVCIEKDEKK